MDVLWRPVDDYLVQGARPTGPSLGSYKGCEIPDTIVDMFGYNYSYVGVAPRDEDGDINPGALEAGEFIVSPGLVYRREGVTRSRWQAIWRS
jgi:hypothetical protein